MIARHRTLIGVAVVSVVATSAAWLAGSRLTSPQEAASRAAPPTPSLITQAVERRELATEVQIRGDLDYDQSTSLTLAGTAESDAVVTKAPPAVGKQLTDGALLLEASGRPVFVLQGTLPVYRTLTPGVTGDDVLQLETALARLGISPGTVDRTFDDATSKAVSAFYLRAGYGTKEPTKDARDAANDARDGVSAARSAEREAIRARSEATTVAPSERLELEGAIAAAETAAAAARTSAAQVAQDGRVAVEDAIRALRDAEAERARAKGAADVRAADAAVRQRAAEVDAARAAAATAAAEAGGGIGDADRQVQIARAALAERLAPSGGGEDAAVADARTAVVDAERRLAEAEAQAGVTVPLGEILFVPSLPRRVADAFLEVGEPATGTAVTISGSELVIRGDVASADRSRLSVGSKVQIDNADLGAAFEGTITKVASTPGAADETGPGGAEGEAGQEGEAVDPDALGADDGGGGSGYGVTIKPGKLPEGMSADSLRGVNFRISVPLTSTDGEVLVVPLAALSASADGSVRVQVEDRPGSTRFVRVDKGLTADGLVEVRPVGGSKERALEVGDRVVVGA